MSATAIVNPQIASQVEGRLTLTTGTPVTSSDVTGATSIKFAPYKGNRCSVLVGSRWVSRTFPELPLTPVNSSFRLEDVFIYDDAGSLELVGTPWDSGGQVTGTITGATNASPMVITSVAHGRSNGDLVGIKSIGGNTAANDYTWRVANAAADTFELEGSTGNGVYTTGGTWYFIPQTRTTAINLTGTNATGVYTQSGTPARRWLGFYMTGPTAGQVDDAGSRRHLVNHYNREIRLATKNISDGHTYTTAAARLFNARHDARMEFLAVNTGAFHGGLWAEAYGGQGYVVSPVNTVALSGNSIRDAGAVAAGATMNQISPRLGYNVSFCVEYGAAGFTVNQFQMFTEIWG